MQVKRETPGKRSPMGRRWAPAVCLQARLFLLVMLCLEPWVRANRHCREFRTGCAFLGQRCFEEGRAGRQQTSGVGRGLQAWYLLRRTPLAPCWHSLFKLRNGRCWMVLQWGARASTVQPKTPELKSPKTISPRFYVRLVGRYT